MAINSPHSCDVPHFYLRPYMRPGQNPFVTMATSYEADYRLTRYDHVDAINPLAMRYAVESLLPYRAAAFFQTEFAAQTLLPFIEERQWTVEWSENRLTVYQLDHLVPGDRLRHFAAEVCELGRLVQVASIAFVASLDERVEHAAARLAAAKAGHK